MGFPSYLMAVSLVIGLQAAAQTNSPDEITTLYPIETTVNPGVNKHQWTAPELVTKVSDGNLIRGFFISYDEERMIKRRWKGLEILDTIQYSGSTATELYFYKHSEEDSTSQDFTSTADSFGTKVAVTGDANYLFVSANIGYSHDHEKNHTKEHNETSTTKYFQAIKGKKIPIKSVDLDPSYMRLNQQVRTALQEINNDNHTNADCQRLQFIDFFDKYGTHFLTGSMELGGSLISISKTYYKGSSISDEEKNSVITATDKFLDVHATFEKGGAGAGYNKSSNDIKSKLLSNIKTHSINVVTLDFEKKGGPPGEDNIAKWSNGLRQQSDTWRIIDKSTDLISTWELLLLHHKSEFQDAEKFAHQMKEAWKYTLELPSFFIPSDDCEVMKELVANFHKLDISEDDARKQLIVNMLAKGKLGAQMDSRYATVKVIPTGEVVMSALQKDPLDDDTTILQFDNLEYLAYDPHMIFLELKHRSSYLGHIIITLNGYNKYPKFGQQMMKLASGNNNEGGTYRGVGFYSIYNYNQPAEYIYIQGYRDTNGRTQTKPLFPVEENGKGPATPIVAGEVRIMRGFQRSMFLIHTKSWPGGDKWTDAIIGKVNSHSLSILQKITDRGNDYMREVTVTDSGLVIIDKN